MTCFDECVLVDKTSVTVRVQSSHCTVEGGRMVDGGRWKVEGKWRMEDNLSGDGNVYRVQCTGRLDTHVITYDLSCRAVLYKCLHQLHYISFPHMFHSKYHSDK